MRPTPTLLGLPRELRDEIIYHTIAADDLRESAEKFTQNYNDADDKHGWKKWLALRSDLLQHATQSNNQPQHTYNFVLAMILTMIDEHEIYETLQEKNTKMLGLKPFDETSKQWVGVYV
ncbi:hypothetical protein CCHR01_03513 [Colletotrichum chrysophilum]|uniref:Uncharacterized protein n=1 Tax=Colletotrichum chrysophilum TaxID=1836956 RepID=A0AAD9EME0_9PEZI|nr:hypothetical protein CCHR01_03513 [Colletotrichum chrysophilum]